MEIAKCVMDIYYYIYTYIFIPESGGMVKFTKELMHPKIKNFIDAALNYHRVSLMASRQLGKTTIASILLQWTINFNKKTTVMMFSLSKESAYKNLKNIIEIHKHIPKFLATPSARRSENKGDFTLTNDSTIIAKYYVSQSDPNNIGRGFTAPCVYFDEVAFIDKMNEIIGAAGPSMSTARESARRRFSPYFNIYTTTPNGSSGKGEYFYNSWHNSFDVERILDDDGELLPYDDGIKIIDSDEHNNGIIKIMYHWSDNPEKDEVYYNNCIKDLNYDMTRVQQEVDLMFVGSMQCVFDNEFIRELKAIHPINEVKLDKYNLNGLNYKLNIYDTTREWDYYLIGVDNARSGVGDYCVINVFSFKEFKQIAQFRERLNIVPFKKIIQQVVEYFYNLSEGRIIICMEKDAIGQGIIEFLLDDPDFSKYTEYFWMDKNEKSGNIPGIKTTSITKPQMIAYANDIIVKNPSYLHSKELIDELKIIERKPNGTISAQSGCKDDTFMAMCFCAYVRNNTYEQYMPSIFYEEKKYEEYLEQNNNSNYKIKKNESILSLLYESDDIDREIDEFNNYDFNKNDGYVAKYNGMSISELLKF